MSRHSWEKLGISVPWSSLPGHIRICRKCGLTRQSIPTDESLMAWRVEWGTLMPDGSRDFFESPRTPFCTEAFPEGFSLDFCIGLIQAQSKDPP